MPQIMQHELFRPDASYMLVGGLGGIGRATALWMVQNGARNLVFMNRSGVAKQEARNTVKELELQGVTVKICACDIANEEQVKEAMQALAKEMPPIRGVIQAAMVLRDNYLEKASVEDYLAVLQPKLQGTWNLHNHLPRDLDYFVMLSSISGVIGNATQSAYAAGSTFMDAFATYRNSLGLPAVTLDLGVIGEVGYLSDHKELSSSMEKQGFHVTGLKVLLALIRSAIESPRREGVQAQTVTGIGAWKEDQSPSNFSMPLFAQMRRRFFSSNGGDDLASSSNVADDPSKALSAATSIEEASMLALKHIISYLATRISISDDNIDPENPPSEYGVDSLIAVEARKWIGKQLGASVAMLEIIACDSVTQLAAIVAKKSKFVKVDGENREKE